MRENNIAIYTRTRDMPIKIDLKNAKDQCKVLS